MKLRVARWLERSLANGPGERFVLWLQGCSLGCPGCFNPELWARYLGVEISVAELASRVHATGGLRGVTLSGGEPLEQAQAVAALLDRLDPGLDRILFTGYTRAEIERDPAKAAVAGRVDLVVAGRYARARSGESGSWSGAGGKELWPVTGRVGAQEGPGCRIEAQVNHDGTLVVTGFPDRDLLDALTASRRDR